MLKLIARIPAVAWLKGYPRGEFPNDLTAGFITAVLLIPQGMAYAVLAGLPPQVGLYASILPPMLYALLGTSRTLSIGPVSVAALLVADALSGSGNAPGGEAYLHDALLLAAMSGMILLLMSLLRFDVLVNFIGHPVLSGFTSGAAILILLSQIQNLTGIAVPQEGSALEIAAAGIANVGTAHIQTMVVGIASIVLLLLFRSPLVRLLQRIGITAERASMVGRLGPIAAIVLLTVAVASLRLDEVGVAIIGVIPAGLPEPNWRFLNLQRMSALLPSALIISVIGYVESVSVAKVLAHRRRQRISNNQEMIALGAANLIAAFSAGMPVAGGFSRSMVNYAAGAYSQLSAVISSVLVAIAAMLFTPLFYYLPKAALAAVIVVAVWPLLNWREAKATWAFDAFDGAALATTFICTLLFSIETALLTGVTFSIAAFVWRSSRPGIVIVGRMAGSEHYRNVLRHKVQTWPQLLLLRIDRSLYFANIGYIEDVVASAVSKQPAIRHLLLICSGVNEIDYSAIDALERLAENLKEAGVTLHLAEVKGPIMDRIDATDFVEKISPGRIFLSTDAAVMVLNEATTMD